MGASKHMEVSKHTGGIQTYGGHPNIQGAYTPVPTQHKESTLCQINGCTYAPICLDAPLYVWMPPICLDPPYVWMPLNVWGLPNIEGVLSYKGVQTYRGHKNMGCSNIWEHPNICGECPNIWGCPNIWETSKHTGWCPHIHGASKHMGMSKHTGDLQTYGRCPNL